MKKKRLLLLIMRTSILQLSLILSLLGNAIASNGNAQALLEKRITLRESNIKLDDLLSTIEKLGDFNFIYKTELANSDKNLSINVSHLPLAAILEQVLAPFNLRYEVSNNYIVIKTAAPRDEIVNGSQVDIPITGTVTDSKGDPLPGVTVKIKGTQVGIVTNASGKYSLTVANNQVVLVFTFVGFETQELIVGNNKVINVVLKDAVNSLNEVVVVGYGTQKKANLTGAVATVSGEDLNKRVATSPTQLLQGQMAGLAVTQASGEAGNEGTVLRVRGYGTYSGAGTAPLVIVDGIPGSLDNLDPQNIASVTLLKDAASASIYGTRAANGVILVTTKQGVNGKFQLSYDYNLGITKATSLPNFIYNSVQYMQLYNQAGINSGIAAGSPNLFSQAQIDAYANTTDKNLYPDYNWLNAVIGTANVQTHHLGLTGGANGTTYNIGLGYVNQPDIMIGFSYKKYNLQFNLNSKVNEKITFGTSFTVNYGQRIYPQDGSQDMFLSTLSQAPLYGPVLPDGSGRYTFAAYPWQPSNKNPIAEAEMAEASNNDAFLQGSIFVNVKLLKGLEWKTSGGINFDYQKTSVYRPVINQYLWFAAPADAPQRTLDVGGQGLIVTDANYIYPVAYTQLTYNKSIKDHHFTLLAGTQEEYNKAQSLSGSRVLYPNNSVQEIDAGSPSAESNSGNASEWSLYSFYGRFNYDYKGKYLLEANARDDGSSRFASGNKWGVFPSVSAGWRISRESFFKKLLPVVSDLKLRASWGKLGNQNIGNYPYQSVYSTGNAYPFSSSTLSDGVRQNALFDQDIKWESTKVFDLGADIGLLENKLNITFDWYNKITDDILSSARNIPAYVGLTAPVVNNGQMKNTGVEISAQYTDRIGDVRFSLGATFEANKNTLLKYGAPSINTTTIIQEGLPYGSFYMYQYQGIFQSAAEVAASPTQPYSPTPGMLKFTDINSDGKIDANDRVVIPGIFPKFDYSFNTNVSYKSFDLSVFFYGSYGQKQYVNGWGEQPFNQGSVPTTDWLNAWTPSNPSTTLPEIYLTGTGNASNNIGTVSTYYLKDASFLRIKNIQLTYNVPVAWARHIAMSSLKLYFAGENLFTFSAYPGLDPERIVSNTRYVTHPQNKVFNIGIRTAF
jgi:TonB-linked SusC/RagA family outer membrane protein